MKNEFILEEIDCGFSLINNKDGTYNVSVRDNDDLVSITLYPDEVLQLFQFLKGVLNDEG